MKKEMQQQKQQQKPKKTREQVKEEFRKALHLVIKTFVDELAIAIRDENPIWFGRENLEGSVKEEIRESIFADCSEFDLNTGTIRNAFPSWLQSEKRREMNVRAWERKNAAKLQNMNQKFIELTKIDLPEPPKPKEDTEGEGWDLEGGRTVTYGEKEKSYSTMKGTITLRCAQLFEALTEINHLPFGRDDLENDYIKPSRDYRKTIVLESDDQSRTTLWNCLGAVDSVIQDMLELLEKEMKK